MMNNGVVTRALWVSQRSPEIRLQVAFKVGKIQTILSLDANQMQGSVTILTVCSDPPIGFDRAIATSDADWRPLASLGRQ